MAHCIKDCNCVHTNTFKDNFHCHDLKIHRGEIHSYFWSLSDKDKLHYFGRTTERKIKKRTRKCKKADEHCDESSRRQYSFKYFIYFGGHTYQVCMRFYTLTLDISVKRIEYYYSERLDRQSGMTAYSTHGKHIKKQISIDVNQSVRDHIDTFPKV